ncbi:uncharacterized protein Z520_08628 [Fonsecaea multimorphosa CBS 102226]|uniref:Aminotransferase class I/classII large domain-containing protein n=1 Tax=Fonsecaea multimorphosa CBS 102226 TaxID=1442371 RepID=A0A0D2KFQ1_9EURO|nr:uncharacterized protein Z520_08628 [Fonsecaea multimorphosa CBS 102226]KIX95508.1 hypothetical protein Z520_08628 [Fonsecaea multimorphosa CBS 102226]OAL21354.1 hypothetical protein AYO22_08077 [Fonsecaea multimorphosa]
MGSIDDTLNGSCGHIVSQANGPGQCSIPCQKGHPCLKDLGILQRTLAPTTTADLFKADCYGQKPKSGIDVRKFLSREGRVRQPSSLKASVAELGEDMISLGTGRPSPDTYPFESMKFAYSLPNATAWTAQPVKINGSEGKQEPAVVRKQDPLASIDLSIALSYGYSLGCEQLIQYLATHVSHVHSPPYSDWEICLTGGNTMAMETAFRNFTDPGDFVLVEEYTYSGMIEAATPLGLKLVPVAMDGDGLSPQSLNNILSTWNEFHPGKPAPRLLYTIPTGHNPTGITQPRHRRQEILNVAEKHDIMILEDDPYYYLNFPQDRGEPDTIALPSYLSLSNTGRVIRLDSTSKILAPGLRLGWLTAPKSVVETFQAAHDLGFIHPSGLSQLVVYKLVSETWGHDGFLHWLKALAGNYQERASAMLKAMEVELGRGVLADICSWSDIRAGMFIWLRVDCSRLTDMARTPLDAEARRQALLSIEDKIYMEGLKEGVLPCKGSLFRTPTMAGTGVVKSKVQPESEPGRSLDNDGNAVFFRLTFASADEASLVRAVGRLGVALRRIFTPVSGEGTPETSCA